MLRPCGVCGDAAQDGRCPEHPRVRVGRLTTTQQGYGSRWQRLSITARRLQPFCSTCATAEDLTTDHLRWPARSLDDVQVLCRSCNSKKGAIRCVVGVNAHA